jgi:Mn-dependent DtxR family transcriptional regulator
MPEEAQIEHVPLNKHRRLEFLEGQKGPITAKVASIDLDTRASTVTEMLERCAAQGLVEREANQRPREYTITETGRRRLELFPSGQARLIVTPCP